MRIDIICVIPDIFHGFLNHSIIKRAQEKNRVKIVIHSLRDYGKGKYRQVDDYQYGGGAGMVLMIEPIHKCIQKLLKERNYQEIIYVTPDGEKLEQQNLNALSLSKNIIILCGRYKGVDQRVRDMFITKEISLGSFVLSGGELAAAVVVDGIIRLLPGVLGDESSALSDSFQDGLLSHSIYTRPAEYLGKKVPKVLLSGNLAEIQKWRIKDSEQKSQNMESK